MALTDNRRDFFGMIRHGKRTMKLYGYTSFYTSSPARQHLIRIKAQEAEKFLVDYFHDRGYYSDPMTDQLVAMIEEQMKDQIEILDAQN